MCRFLFDISFKVLRLLRRKFIKIHPDSRVHSSIRHFGSRILIYHHLREKPIWQLMLYAPPQTGNTQKTHRKLIFMTVQRFFEEFSSTQGHLTARRSDTIRSARGQPEDKPPALSSDAAFVGQRRHVSLPI